MGELSMSGRVIVNRVRLFIFWKRELLWDFEYNSDKFLLHHDIERLPNGNILMIAWEKKSRREAIEAGRNPATIGEEGLWPDCYN